MKYYLVISESAEFAAKFVDYGGKNEQLAKSVYSDRVDDIITGLPHFKVELRQYNVPNNWQSLDETLRAELFSFYDISKDYDIIASVQGIRYNAGC